MSKRERRVFGSLRRLSSGRWQVRYRDLAGVVHTGPHTFASKADAARYLAMVEADLHRGAWADPKLGRITLAEWAERWQQTTTNLRPTTRDLYAYLLRRFLLPTFGKAALSSIDVLAVRTWLANLQTQQLIRKCTVRGQAAAPGGAKRSRVRAVLMGARSGGGFEGDLVAKGLELADVVALGALSVDAGVVEAGAQIVEAGGRVGQQVPDDDQDGAADRDDGLLAAPPAGDAPVALAQEGVGPAGDHGRLAQHPGQLRVAVPGGVLAFGLAR
jgi:hypothetical protein